MRVSVFIGVSLDGFIARTDGGIDWLDAPGYNIEGEDFGYHAFIKDVDVLVIGRGTYEKALTFATWPYGKRVVVLSRSEQPKATTPNTEISNLEPSLLLSNLEREGCQKVYLDGGKIIQACIRAGLVTDLTITRLPVLIGEGLPLFGATGKDVHLAHKETKTWPNGFVQSQYEIKQ